MTRKDLQEIALKKIDEAECLFKNGFFEGAYYLAGYALETALKARICKLLGSDYPPLGNNSNIGKAYKTHDLNSLFTLGGLDSLIEASENSIDLKINRSLILKWNESYRYTKIGTVSELETREFLNAISDNTNGILTWLKKQW